VIDVVLRAATAADAAAIAAVRIDSWRATYRGVMPDAYLEGMRLEDSTALWSKVLSADTGKTSVFVAERDGTVVGFAAGKQLDEEKFGLDAELAALYLQPHAQRAGIGRRLLSMVADAHQVAGAQGLLVWVLAKNVIARRFYEGLQAELLVEQPFTWDGLDLVEAGYGWRDLNALRAACAAARE
jgi:ribosomal protein S18 acetylase RimI-like enzyme